MRVVVAGWVGSTNLGDELAFAGLLRLLDGRGATVAAVSADPAATRRVHGVGAVRHDRPDHLSAAIGRADAMVFGGGGIVQDVTSALNLPYHLARVQRARVHRTPYAAIGLGVGGLDTRAGRWQVRHGLRGAVGIAVRDAASRELLAEVGVPGARVASDLAFALEPPAATPAGDGDRLVACLRPWSERPSRLPAAARGDATPRPHVDALARALDDASRATGLTVRFIALQSDRDGPFHRRVAARMHQPVEFAVPGLDGILAEFTAARAVVTMRYHGGVAAALAGLPVVLISYALKVDALAAELGGGARRLGWEPDELAHIPAALAAVVDQRQAVLAARDALRDRQQVNATLLDELLDTASGRRR